MSLLTNRQSPLQISSLLTKENSQILRGVAILFIMLHNFIHFSGFGFSSENEMSFSTDNAASFFSAIYSGTHIIYEFFSHLGWIGVPVFVFLTGYGVSFTPPHLTNYKSIQYIKRNYLKLFILMLPAILFFAGVDVIKGELWPGLLKRASYLTMLVNFAYPFFKCNPGVYWYFGLTFQFYLLWALFSRSLNKKNLLIWSVIFLVGTFAISVYGSPKFFSIYRHCFTGWFPVFAIGVWLGMYRKGEKLASRTSVWGELLSIVVFIMAILFMSKWMISWLFIPIVALAFFLVIGLLLLRTCYLSLAFRWVGRYSACLFVCHPIARTIVLNGVYPKFTNLLFIVVVYLVLSVFIALLYNQLYQWLFIRLVPPKV